MQIKGFGYIPDLPDYRDCMLPHAYNQTLPARVDLRDTPVPIWDQEALGSCTANACGALFRFVDRKQGGDEIVPSRLFTYYQARAMEGSAGTDSGAMIRDAMKSLANDGAALEEDWPYDISRFAQKPPPQAYAAAQGHQALVYLRVSQTLTDMKSCLVAGYPLVIGATLYNSFFDIGPDGLCPDPSGGVAGGHAFLVVGYDNSPSRFICQNSWGEKWGDHGYFYMRYSYLTNDDLAADLWTLRSVEEVEPPAPPSPDPSPKITEFDADFGKQKANGCVQIWPAPGVDVSGLAGKRVHVKEI